MDGSGDEGRVSCGKCREKMPAGTAECPHCGFVYDADRVAELAAADRAGAFESQPRAPLLLPPYRTIGPRARAVVALLGATIAIYAAAIVAEWWRWRLLRKLERGGVVSIDTANLSDTLFQVVAVLQLLVLIATAVVFLRWFKLAYADVDAFGATRRFARRWAVGAWFVPVLNLWRPK